MFFSGKVPSQKLQDVLDQTPIFLQNLNGHVLGSNETSFFQPNCISSSSNNAPTLRDPM
jgi:hypothetical protein